MRNNIFQPAEHSNGGTVKKPIVCKRIQMLFFLQMDVEFLGHLSAPMGLNWSLENRGDGDMDPAWIWVFRRNWLLPMVFKD